MWMTLAPGEVFQHSHAEHSITMLVKGRIDLVVGETRTPLVRHKATPIDADLPHRLINVGGQIAVVKCVHADIVIDPPPKP
jgi:mannose-6-phosphate isomerase-like protein (cupin superfamily)